MLLTKQQWNNFLPDLKNRNCCLLLGPEISSIHFNNITGFSVLSAFSKYMEERLIANDIPYNQNMDNFYYRANKFINHQYPENSTEFEKEIRVFVRQVLAQDTPYFNKLIKLPFNTIVNMVPDDLV